MLNIENYFRRGQMLFVQIGAFGLLVLSVMLTVDVLFRWITGRPFVGVFEISQVLLVLVTFSAVGAVHSDNRQLSVDILSARAKGKTAKFLRLFDASIGIIVFGVLLWKSWEELLKAIQGKFLLRGMIEIPTAFPLSFILIGTFSIVVSLLFIFFQNASHFFKK